MFVPVLSSFVDIFKCFVLSVESAKDIPVFELTKILEGLMDYKSS